MVWDIKEFNEHRREWLDNPIISKKEILNYLYITKEQLSKLIKVGWIGKCLYTHSSWKGHQRWVYDRAEIIAFAHEVGLRT